MEGVLPVSPVSMLYENQPYTIMEQRQSTPKPGEVNGVLEGSERGLSISSRALAPVWRFGAGLKAFLWF